jgi:hypothetical protein
MPASMPLKSAALSPRLGPSLMPLPTTSAGETAVRTDDESCVVAAIQSDRVQVVAVAGFTGSAVQ